MKRFIIKKYMRIILDLSVVVILTTAFFCSCRSKESMTKETIENKTEKQTTIKDSVISNSLYTSEDTTFTNEETTIHQITYDTSKIDSDGNHPIKSITDITKKKASNSKGKVSQTSASSKVQNTKQIEKQKTVDKKKNVQKITSQVKKASNAIRYIIILILLFIGGYFVVKYWNIICTFAKKIKSIS